MFKKIWKMFNSNGFPTLSTTLRSSDEPDTAAGDSESFDCPSCGGPLEIDFIGQHQSDKVANCPYCRRTIDLPDATNANSRIRTRERVIERPNERIVERVSEWSQHSSTTLDWPEDWKSSLDEIGSDLLQSKWKELPFGQDHESSNQKWEINGKKFSSPEEMQAYVRQNFPPEMADRLLAMMDREQH